MKKQFLMILLAGIALFGLTNCEEQTDGTPQEELNEVTTEAVMDVLTMRARSQGMVEDLVFGGFGEFGRIGNRGGAANLANPTYGVAGDSTSTDDDDDDRRRRRRSCATITETENANGSVTTVIDYGDGCEEHGVLIAGKVTITEQESESGDSFEFSVNVENYSETFTYENDSTGAEETESFTINGTYSGQGSDDGTTFSETFEYDFNVTFEDGSWEALAGSGESRETEERYEVLSDNFSGSNSEGDTFSGQVTTTLVMDFTCDDDVFIFTSGVEEWTFNNENVTIDYGDGTCDNIITITENGVSEEVDLSEEWEERCDYGDDDEEDDD